MTGTLAISLPLPTFHHAKYNMTEVRIQIVISDVIALHLIPSETKIINESNTNVALSFLGFCHIIISRI